MTPDEQDKENEPVLLPDNTLTVDDVLEKVGSFSRYQYRLLFVMAFMKIFGDAFQIMIPAFLAAEPPWACAVNSTVCNVTGSILPGHAHYKLRCKLPRHEWVFDTSEFNSIVSQWDLVCERSSLSSLSKSVVFAGYMGGAFLGGVLSDKFGRKPIVYFPSVLCNVLALAASFVNTFWLFTLLRALIGICIGSSGIAMFVLLVEYVGPRHRAIATCYLWYFWALSAMLLALWGYLIRDWRELSIAGAAPGLLQVFFWWHLQESTRWLLINNKNKEAIQIFSDIAKYNRKEMPQRPVEQTETKPRLGDIRDLFRSFKITRRTMICFFCWVVVAMGYYGISFGAGNFGGNRYLVFFLVSIVEFPSNWAAYKLMDRFGRKKAAIFSYLFASVFSTCAVLLQRDLSDKGFLAGRIIMSMSAKLFINMAFITIYVFTAELYPTVIRNVAVGLSSSVARLGSIAAPFIIWLVRIHVLLPYSIMAVCACVAAILCCTLPETKYIPTPEVFQDHSEEYNEENDSEKLTVPA